MRKSIFKFWPILLILLVWFIFSTPFFLKNKVPFPSTYQVNHFPPWSSYERFWGPVKNNAMPDIVGQIYPWKHFSIEQWKKSQIAFWNPNSFAGNPHLANYQSTVFSPFNFLFFIFSFVDAWSILILLQPLLAGLSTLLLLREFRVSKQGSLIGSVSFMFSGFIVVWMAYGTLSMAISFLPLAIYLIQKYFNKLNLIFLFFLSLVISFSFFSGHFQTSIYFFLFLISFFAFKIYETRKIKESFSVFFSILIGMLIALIQIIPSIGFYSNSVRSEIFITGGAIPWFYLVNIFSPDFYGNPVTRNDWFGYYAEWASFIGIIPLTLAFFSISRKNLLSLFFIFSGLISLLLAIDTPLISVISSLKIPVLSTSIPSRIIVLFSFSFAVLSGFGFDNLKKMIIERNIKKIILPFLLIVLIISCIWLYLLIFKPMPFEKLIIAKRNLFLPTILVVFNLLIVTFSFFNKKVIILTVFYLVLATSFDSLRFAQKWMPFDPKGLVFPNVKIIEGIKNNIGYGRIFGNFGASIDTYYDFPGIEGYDPLYIGRYGEFIRSAGNGEFTQAERSVVSLPRVGKYTDRVLDLLGVSLIFNPIADTNQSWAYHVWEDKEKHQLIFKDEKFELYKNKSAFPRATLFYSYETILKKEDIIKRFYSDDFDFRKVLILEEKPQNVNYNVQGAGSADIISYNPNDIKINVFTDQPALLFLSDNFYPNWRVKVNGKEAKIYRADYSFRAIEVPSGKSSVNFYYNFL
ncbi:hypothetical protein C4559_03260 [Candidatus Microgenomates bacterium]|nr:MAG: hypothetical protein C4559_03260 [Candidatus Microgenomates bacterium]